MLETQSISLVDEFREYINISEVRDAYDVLVDLSRIHYGLSCFAKEKGVVRDFRFYADEKTQPFAFIINQASLLFYLRLPAVRTGLYSVSSLDKIFEGISENKRGEITIKITNPAQSRLVVTEVLNKWRR